MHPGSRTYGNSEDQTVEAVAGGDPAPQGLIATSTGPVWIDNEGILHVQPKRDGRQTLDAARENLAAFTVLGRGVRRPLLVDIRQLNSPVDRAARQLYASQEAASVLAATGLLIQSAASRLIGNFFLGVSRPISPLRLFLDEGSALDWLRGFRA